MLNKNVETFLGCDCDYKDADIVLFGAPFDSTTSYRPGARFGSRAIRAESYGLETYSPYQDKDLGDYYVFDSGELELCFGSSEAALGVVQRRTQTILEDGKLPVMLGGEHSLTLGAVRALLEKYPDLCIIHFDAHTDLREDYLGAPLSHASVIRRCWELLGDGRIWQFGIRSGERAEFEWAKTHTALRPFDFEGLVQAVQEIDGKPVYFTLDLDVLDPAFFCGTGTPEAGGVSFLALLEAIKTVCTANVVGCDVMELAPTLDQSGASTALACKVVRELLLAINH
ncbi:agmatinase [Oscillospiraceae bacterium LTW-04]|nr:agmatinase [Oscillospiraceae bacterium MB24-C1]